MANRVVLGQLPDGSQGLKVSKPGHNALTAPTSQLIFSSDWSAMSVFKRDTHTYSWPPPESWGNPVGSYASDVALGHNFGTPPIVTFEALIGGVWTVLSGEGSRAFNLRRSIRVYRRPLNTNLWTYTDFFNMYAVVTPTHIQFRGEFEAYEISPPNLTLRYTVFTYNY